jgi:hypothetical protein
MFFILSTLATVVEADVEAPSLIVESITSVSDGILIKIISRLFGEIGAKIENSRATRVAQ